MVAAPRVALVPVIAAAAVLMPTATAARVNGHLYVGTQTRPYAILRFPLHDGIPANTPDFSYPGHFTNIAVGPDGSVYGVHWRDQKIVVFAPGNAVPVRSIVFPASIPNCQGPYAGPTLIGDLAVDKRGDLFVAYTTYLSGFRSAVARVRIRSAVAFPCLGVVAFSPTAHGAATPIAAISLSGQYLNGVTVDRDGLLYVANSYWNQVQMFASPANHPKAAGYLGAGMSYPQTLATDAAEDVYELDGGLLTKNGVNVYTTGSGKNSPPASTLTFESAYDWVEDIAVWDYYLYASDINYHSDRSIDVYDARASGPTAPIFSLPLKGIWFIAAGP
jgi:hypothetical protein